jgi:hypothetical protein
LLTTIKVTLRLISFNSEPSSFIWSRSLTLVSGVLTVQIEENGACILHDLQETAVSSASSQHCVAETLILQIPMTATRKHYQIGIKPN